jgi:hypothetical protein
MKHCFLALSLIVVFAACTIDETTVINNSNKMITFRWSKYDDNKITLNPQEAITSEYLYTELFDLQPYKRVSQKRSQTAIVVSELPSWEVRVNNALGYPVTLTADGWMDDMSNIQPGYIDDDNHKGIIFTSKPVFSIYTTDNFLATIQYQIVDNIMYVMIK